MLATVTARTFQVVGGVAEKGEKQARLRLLPTAQVGIRAMESYTQLNPPNARFQTPYVVQT